MPSYPSSALDTPDPADDSAVADDRLRLIFTCCHPSLGILRLYDRLLDVSPSPVIELNRAVALAEVEGPKAALIAVDRLSLERSHVFHAIRADLLRRLGRDRDAVDAYDDAIAHAENACEREFLVRTRDALTAS